MSTTTWNCIHCNKKFPKDEEKLYQKIMKLNFHNMKDKKTVIHHRDNNPIKFEKHQKWLNHLLYMPGNVLLDGICPNSICVFCLQFKGQVHFFNNRASFNYHRNRIGF